MKSLNVTCLHYNFIQSYKIFNSTKTLIQLKKILTLLQLLFLRYIPQSLFKYQISSNNIAYMKYIQIKIINTITVGISNSD